jgi:hypothetical protein
MIQSPLRMLHFEQRADVDAAAVRRCRSWCDRERAAA